MMVYCLFIQGRDNKGSTYEDLLGVYSDITFALKRIPACEDAAKSNRTKVHIGFVRGLSNVLRVDVVDAASGEIYMTYMIRGTELDKNLQVLS